MMLQPTRVLPSNASPVHEDDGVHETRILQEHSGNRQHHEYPYLAHAVNDLKYQQSFLSENSYLEQHQPPPHPNYFYQQSNVIRQHHNHGLGRRRPTDHEIACIMQRVRRNADDLCRRFNASDGYVKYRQRQKQNTKIKADQKWPEHLELAFFQGMFSREADERHCRQLTTHFSIGHVAACGSPQANPQRQA
jgi:transcriptional enhancer factor